MLFPRPFTGNVDIEGIAGIGNGQNHAFFCIYGYDHDSYLQFSFVNYGAARLKRIEAAEVVLKWLTSVRWVSVRLFHDDLGIRGFGALLLCGLAPPTGMARIFDGSAVSLYHRGDR